MKKFIITFLLFLITAGSGCTLSKTTQTKATLPTENFVKIIRKLEILDCEKIKNSPCVPSQFYSSASGLSLGSMGQDKGSIIITAGHICDSGISEETLKLVKTYKVTISVISVSGEEFLSSVLISTDVSKTKRDLCLLKVPDLETKPVKIATKDPKIGDELYNIAAPRGVFHPPTVPIFKGIFSGPVDSTNVLATIPAAGGSSGSPVLNEKGELVGILFAAVPEFPNISLSSNRVSTVSFILEGVRILKSEAKN